ncbi:META domain-containing protein [Rhodoblastus acidophilus]|uniref:META domain-containing protein n=1 Tax=Candidatus Rhodoblastus alkanivorans TaxID=2954117 RepID=UPI001FAA7805|nr:META domain-containing protein [Candidatus Rhodoblastus alkanivorans]MCI4678041.1 META domain-containing protein [Candidatus Rhodoblastus alkanivorans]MDI4642666.1 META domain-containing protein [Rhodoblastus acidophilus]
MRASASLALSIAFFGLAPASAAENALSGKWRIERIAEVGAFDASKASFDILPDGRMATTVGCNRIAGKPKIDGDAIAFGAMAMTKMACPPPLDDIEAKYGTALEAARTFHIAGDELTFADGKGDAVLVFRRAE